MMTECTCMGYRSEQCLHAILRRIATALEDIAAQNTGLVETLQAIENEIADKGDSSEEKEDKYTYENEDRDEDRKIAREGREKMRRFRASKMP